MKSNEEMTASVLQRIEEYEQRHRVIRRRMQTVGSTAACFAILLAGIAVWHGRAVDLQKPEVTAVSQGTTEPRAEMQPESGIAQSGAPEIIPGETMPAATEQHGTTLSVTTVTALAQESGGSTETAVSGGYLPGNEQTVPPHGTTARIDGTVTGVTSGAQTTQTQTLTSASGGSIMDFYTPFFDRIYHERAAGSLPADAHRPAGYSENIGSALALIMSVREPAYAEYLERVKDKPDAVGVGIPQYPVVIWQAEGTAVTGEPRALIGEGYVCSFSLGGKVYHSATVHADAIVRCAEAGWQVSYVGRGTTPTKERSWDTVDGILANCELYGDGFTGWSGDALRDPECVVLFQTGEPE